MKKILLLLAVPIISAGASCVTDKPTSPDTEEVIIVEPKNTNVEISSDKACDDRCGDGVCQEIVCMAVGCPCAETPDNCPEDCKE